MVSVWESNDKRAIFNSATLDFEIIGKKNC